MSDRTLYRLVSGPEPEGPAVKVDSEWLVPVEPVDVVEMTDHIDGWFTVSNVYAPDLPEANYRVAIVIMEADDE